MMFTAIESGPSVSATAMRSTETGPKWPVTEFVKNDFATPSGR